LLTRKPETGTFAICYSQEAIGDRPINLVRWTTSPN